MNVLVNLVIMVENVMTIPKDILVTVFQVILVYNVKLNKLTVPMSHVQREQCVRTYLGLEIITAYVALVMKGSNVTLLLTHVQLKEVLAAMEQAVFLYCKEGTNVNAYLDGLAECVILT